MSVSEGRVAARAGREQCFCGRLTHWWRIRERKVSLPGVSFGSESLRELLTSGAWTVSRFLFSFYFFILPILHSNCSFPPSTPPIPLCTLLLSPRSIPLPFPSEKRWGLPRIPTKRGVTRCNKAKPPYQGWMMQPSKKRAGKRVRDAPLLGVPQKNPKLKDIHAEDVAHTHAGLVIVSPGEVLWALLSWFCGLCSPGVLDPSGSPLLQVSPNSTSYLAVGFWSAPISCPRNSVLWLDKAMIYEAWWRPLLETGHFYIFQQIRHPPMKVYNLVVVSILHSMDSHPHRTS